MIKIEAFGEEDCQALYDLVRSADTGANVTLTTGYASVGFVLVEPFPDFNTKHITVYLR